MSYVTSSRRSVRRGAVLVYMVLIMTVLFGVMAIALDGGALLAERRHAQATADAAALAGAADMFAGSLTPGYSPSSAVTSALTTAAANGYSNDGVQSTVTALVNPSNYSGGPHAGTQIPAGYIEVTVTFNQARAFSVMWGSSDIPVSARAVARGKWVPATPALMALGPSGPGTIATTGNGSITISGNDLVDNSSSSQGITTSGTGATVTDPGGIFTVGSPGYSGNVTPTPVPNQAPQPDPLRFTPEPSKPANAPAFTTDPSTGVVTYYPGYYASGPTFKNGFTYVFSPGIYYIDGALTDNSNAIVTGSGVMIFIDQNGSLNLGGNGTLTLSAPTSGIYQGMLIFQSRSNSTMLQVAGGASSSLTGTIYAPAATVSAAGGGIQFASQIIASQVQNKGAANGSGAVSISWSAGNVARTRQLNLVE